MSAFAAVATAGYRVNPGPRRPSLGKMRTSGAKKPVLIRRLKKGSVVASARSEASAEADSFYDVTPEYCGVPIKITGRPKRIVLIRHAESEGNVDETMYQRKPDHRIELTERGKKQARQAGLALKELLDPDEQVYVYVSPYTRTMQTLYELGQTLGPERVSGVREEPRMREQDFGNFQDHTMQELKKERHGFGRFFFRFPNGESASDVYDRVTSFRETLRNDMNFGRYTENCTVLIITHGLTLRVFLMRWYKWTCDMFDKLRNPGNAELVVMERGERGRYSMLSESQGEDFLLKMGFTEDMIEDQRWARTASMSDLNSSWATSKGTIFFDGFPDRLEASRRAVKRADETYFSTSETTRRKAMKEAKTKKAYDEDLRPHG